MSSSYTINKNIEKPGHNDYIDDWDVPVNANSGLIDACLGNVTYINMTGRSSYTLTYADLQATTIVFQNTINNATVNVMMPTGVGGAFTIINNCSNAGTSSLLQLAWTVGGNTYPLNISQTQMMVADGSTNTWAPSAPQLSQGPVVLTVTGSSDGSPLVATAAQSRYPMFVLSGSLTGTGGVQFPSTTAGVIGLYCSFSGGGTCDLFLSGGGQGINVTGNGAGHLIMAIPGTGLIKIV